MKRCFPLAILLLAFLAGCRKDKMEPAPDPAPTPPAPVAYDFRDSILGTYSGVEYDTSWNVQGGNPAYTFTTTFTFTKDTVHPNDIFANGWRMHVAPDYTLSTSLYSTDPYTNYTGAFTFDSTGTHVIFTQSHSYQYNSSRSRFTGTK